MTQNDPVADTRVVGDLDPEVHEMLEDFVKTCQPVDTLPLLVMRDNATGALRRGSCPRKLLGPGGYNGRPSRS
jgi:hypothetical protein